MERGETTHTWVWYWSHRPLERLEEDTGRYAVFNPSSPITRGLLDWVVNQPARPPLGVLWPQTSGAHHDP